MTSNFVHIFFLELNMYTHVLGYFQNSPEMINVRTQIWLRQRQEPPKIQKRLRQRREPPRTPDMIEINARATKKSLRQETQSDTPDTFPFQRIRAPLIDLCDVCQWWSDLPILWPLANFFFKWLQDSESLTFCLTIGKLSSWIVSLLLLIF